MNVKRTIATITVALTGATLVACSNSGTDSATSTAGDASIVIQHAFGETVIPDTPERVATIGWANQEVPLALGVVPVGMGKVTWGDDDDDGILPWVEEKLAELGGETPALFDETDGVPFEDIAATEPDVILAAYSGITQEDYDQLSKIAPVVAYPEKAWGITFEELVLINSKAIGKEAEGEKLWADLKTKNDSATTLYPGLAGKKVLFSAFSSESDYSKVGFYTPADPRPGYLYSVGLEVPEVVKANAGADSFWTEVSAENPEQFADVDLIVTYGSSDEAANAAELAALQADPLLGKIPAIAEGRVAYLGDGPLASATNPAPLGTPWAFDQYFSLLETAVSR